MVAIGELYKAAVPELLEMCGDSVMQRLDDNSWQAFTTPCHAVLTVQ